MVPLSLYGDSGGPLQGATGAQVLGFWPAQQLGGTSGFTDIQSRARSKAPSDRWGWERRRTRSQVY